MWEKLFDLITKVFTLTSKVERLEKDVEDLRRDNKQMLEVINEQRAKIDVLVYAVQSESDRTKSWVEKELARFERRLPSGNVKEENEK